MCQNWHIFHIIIQEKPEKEPVFFQLEVDSLESEVEVKQEGLFGSNKTGEPERRSLENDGRKETEHIYFDKTEKVTQKMKKTAKEI